MTLPILLAIIGIIVIILGIMGGAIKIKEEKIPLLPNVARRLATLVGVILIVVGAWLYFPGWRNAVHEFFSFPPTPTEFISVPIETGMPLPSPTITRTPILTPTSTATPLPPALKDIFPQVGTGQTFSYSENGAKSNALIVNYAPCIHTGEFGLQLTYVLITTQYAGWGVRWDALPGGHFDATPYKAFNFWVRNTASGYEVFQVGLKDTNAKVVWVESSKTVNITTDWKQATFPLSGFKGVDLANLANFTFNFTSDFATGTVCIDDIAFTP